MTEQEWLECIDPMPMLEFLLDKASARKLRLFGCACCRRIWDQLAEAEVYQESVEIAERFADGVASLDELKVGYRQSTWNGSAIEIYVYAAQATCVENLKAKFPGYEDVEETFPAVMEIAWSTAEASVPRYVSDDLAARLLSLAKNSQSSLLKDIFGNPFQPVAIDPTWLTWHEAAIPKLAQSIYNKSAFNHLPSLADALDDAGCTEKNILNHCRQTGEHVRGCWVLDLLLRKE